MRRAVALDIAAHTSEAWVARANTAIHWNLVAMRANTVASRTHPATRTVATNRWIKRAIAHTATSAIASTETVGNFAASS